MNIKIPEFALVLLIGTSSSGKSTFAKKHFLGTEVISSDFCRALVSDSEDNLEANKDAFELLHYMVSKRLQRLKLTVVDATNVQESGRKELLQLARKHYALPVAIVFNLPEQTCQDRHLLRLDRDFGKHVIRNQNRQLRKSVKRLKKEGFRYLFTFQSEEEVNEVKLVERNKLWNNKRELSGPFDIIGDIHGCFDELRTLLKKLGYQVTKHKDRSKNYGYTVISPTNRKVIFVGDLVDRGPASNEVLRLAMSMVENGQALCVCGNHDAKLLKKLNGKNVNLKHGLEETMEQLSQEPAEFMDALRHFLDGLISHYMLDDGKLVVAHAGLREDMQGRASGTVRSFCLYGETTGEIDSFGLPVRHNWAKEYRGKATVVFGHTPVPEAEWLNNTIDIDNGCVFGGKLTALRYPERSIVSVGAKQVYCIPTKPLDYEENYSLTAQQAYDDLPDISDVLGRLNIQTKLKGNITIYPENTAAALEIMSRFAINPKWLIYLPPTMSPCATSSEEDYLEYPTEALEYYSNNGIEQVICQEKHMGSRAVIVLGKNKDVIKERFGIENEGIGVCYTRTGRAFFPEKRKEQEVLGRIARALSKSGFWKEQETDWVCLDCEIMPWSAKSQKLLEEQYAAVGSSGKQSLTIIIETLKRTSNPKLDVQEMELLYTGKQVAINGFIEAYRQYCWPVNSVDDYKIAPFHVLATEGNLHTDKDHLWHMNTIKKIADAEKGILMATNFKVIDLTNVNQKQEAIDWWLSLTKKGGEGMVVKPFNFIEKNEYGVLQPAVKCRGKEYLRIIYGPEYLTKSNLKRLRRRGLGKKRSLALREFALGVEGLDRFVKTQSLRRVHECAFSVLALESEPVDPRL